MNKKPVTRTTDQARAGSTPHIVRYVLAGSLGLAILCLVAVVAIMSFA